MGFSIDPNYIDVATRIGEFREKHPEGSLQPADLAEPFTFTTINGKEAVIVVAAAYRTPDDPRPGIGMAYESIPGATNFTRGSELQNAETAAWGRAIVAVLAADTKRGIASGDEVRNRRAEQEEPPREPRRLDPAAQFEAQFKAAEGNAEKLKALRVWAANAGAPDAVKARINEAINGLPVEGVVQ